MSADPRRPARRRFGTPSPRRPVERGLPFHHAMIKTNSGSLALRAAAIAVVAAGILLPAEAAQARPTAIGVAAAAPQSKATKKKATKKKAAARGARKTKSKA